MIKLTLTRHGETLENQRHVLQGQLQGTLSSLGIVQAEQLAERLRNEPLDAIICSDLARSLDTAIAIAKRHGLVPQETPLLREMDWGVYTGKQLDDVDWMNLPPGVETVENLFLRAIDFTNYVKINHPGQRILAVGHGAFNRAIIAYLQGKSATDMIDLPIMENTACISLEIRD